jgi:hypothetical protein
MALNQGLKRRTLALGANLKGCSNLRRQHEHFENIKIDQKIHSEQNVKNVIF